MLFLLTNLYTFLFCCILTLSFHFSIFQPFSSSFSEGSGFYEPGDGSGMISEPKSPSISDSKAPGYATIRKDPEPSGSGVGEPETLVVSEPESSGDAEPSSLITVAPSTPPPSSAYKTLLTDTDPSDSLLPYIESLTTTTTSVPYTDTTAEVIWNNCRILI